MTKTITAEQLNGEKGGLFRQAEIREISLDDRTVELAFSSEVPVSRWFGDEVLSHEGGAMRLDRLEAGAALLVNHDWDDQVGVVERVTIGEDRRGRALVRFGKGARANEIWQDVADGIRKHVSVGYAVHKVEVESRKGQPDLVRVTDWEPFEISVVSVPADPTVGVGRSMGSEQPATENRNQPENMEAEMADENKTVPQPVNTVDEAALRAAGTDAERNRVRSILEMGEKYGQGDLAGTYARDGKSPEDFQRALLDKMNANRGGNVTDGSADVGLSDKEVRQYSFLKVLRALAAPTDRAAQQAAAFEFEASRAAADMAGREPKGIMVPADVLRRALNSTTTGTAAGDTGGFSIATDLMSQSFIDLLRNRAVAMQLGTPMGGLVGNVDIPRQASGASGYWIGEDAEATLDGLEMDQISMNAKTVAAMSEITRKLLQQSSQDVEALVRRDLATALALTIDKAFFYGSGSANEPRGVVNYAGINAVDFGGTGAGAGAGALPTYAEVVAMESAIAADNADVASMAYVGNAAMRGHFKTTQKFSGTDGSPIWEPGNTVNGYRTETTNQINNGDLIFGNFADAMIGMWGGLDLTADPYTHSARGRLRIVAMQDVDFVLRRLESFCLGRDATA
jgi:HK97 family phage major capsid protein/HK97 family phage prohead protease